MVSMERLPQATWGERRGDGRPSELLRNKLIWARQKPTILRRQNDQTLSTIPLAPASPLTLARST
jgi:hypothetical protein